ncbi:hypothetical protein BDN70DRAFT_923793 [Pholiota conissans]|uniref:Heterokaryon incompatibility domain-containing protein n=1 Tax=Pholiota conissans TaxID=109636 RepID=A0A9P6CXL4_9AGAR|nr:hypothetical protein BDN70DRAFT_923793 [Pholiota conissans]
MSVACPLVRLQRPTTEEQRDVMSLIVQWSSTFRIACWKIAVKIPNMTDHSNPFASASILQAHTVIEALENIIVPIINFHVPGQGAKKRTLGQFRDSNGDLILEAKQLVSALERFISALIVPGAPSLRDGSGKSKTRPKVLKSASLPTLDRTLSSQHLSKDRVHKLALEKARHHVFNKMPIRLLTFRTGGSGIELIERGTLFERISIAMESDIDEAMIQSHFEPQRSLADNEELAAGNIMTQYAKYAILSHTWLRDLSGEVTYTDWKTGEYDIHSKGYQKLSHFCRIAATEHSVSFGWMDTICINKESSAELDESIRSMYNWYRSAFVCITYLSKTESIEHMREDPWFTRGWTLQEMLAPRSIEFYGTNWKILAPDASVDERKQLLYAEIEAATSITRYDLLSFNTQSGRTISISKKMKWAANRQVTREEDTAYSLMGIFSVSLTIAYGEGSERAFARLMKEILNLAGTFCLDILNWGSGPGSSPYRTSSSMSSLLPSSPKQYLWSWEKYIPWYSPLIPITLTHLKLHISVLLMPAVSIETTSSGAPLPWNPVGQFYAHADVDLLVQAEYGHVPRTYNVLDAAASRTFSGWDKNNTRFHLVFGILNCREIDNAIHLPHEFPGFAVCLHRTFLIGSLEPVALATRKLPTSHAVVFNINNVSKDRQVISKDDLAKHGMQLSTMYL